MDVVRHVRNGEVTDMLGDTLKDGEEKSIQLVTLIKVVLRSVKSEQIEELLTHGRRVAEALQKPLSDLVVTLRKEDHEWVMKHSKTAPWINAMVRESFERAMQDYTEDVDASENSEDKGTKEKPAHPHRRQT